MHTGAHHNNVMMGWVPLGLRFIHAPVSSLPLPSFDISQGHYSFMLRQWLETKLFASPGNIAFDWFAHDLLLWQK